MVKILTKDEKYSVIYTTTGTKEEVLFDIKEGYILGGTIRVTGGSSDIFHLQTKTVSDFKTEISSNNGTIPPLEISSKGSGIRLIIDTNISENIELEVLL